MLGGMFYWYKNGSANKSIAFGFALIRQMPLLLSMRADKYYSITIPLHMHMRNTL